MNTKIWICERRRKVVHRLVENAVEDEMLQRRREVVNRTRKVFAKAQVREGWGEVIRGAVVGRVKIDGAD